MSAFVVAQPIGDRNALREQRRQRARGQRQARARGSSEPTVTSPLSEPATPDASSSALVSPTSLLPVDRSLPLRPTASGQPWRSFRLPQPRPQPSRRSERNVVLHRNREAARCSARSRRRPGRSPPRSTRSRYSEPRWCRPGWCADQSSRRLYVIDVVELVVQVKRPRAVRIDLEREHRAPARRRGQRVVERVRVRCRST